MDANVRGRSKLVALACGGLLCACSSSSGGGAGAGMGGAVDGGPAPEGASAAAAGPDGSLGAAEASVVQQPGSDAAQELSACASGTASVGGTFGGQALAPESVFAGTTTSFESEANLDVTTVFIFDASVAAGIGAASQLLEFGVVGMPAAVGTFDVSADASATGVFANYSGGRTAGGCSETLAEYAESGSITITALTASEIAGSFTLAMRQSQVALGPPVSTAPDAISGTFQAPICPAASALLGLAVDGGCSP